MIDIFADSTDTSKRDLAADKESLKHLFRKALSDEYLKEHKEPDRSNFAIAGDYVGYGICAVVDDIAEHWLDRAITAEAKLKELGYTI